MSESNGDRQAIACNYKDATLVTAKGALAYVLTADGGGGYRRVMLLARSRSGRWIEKWENIRKLENFRVKTIVPEYPLYERLANVSTEALACLLQVSQETT